MRTASPPSTATVSSNAFVWLRNVGGQKRSAGFTGAQVVGAESITFGFCPIGHLYDDDTQLENLRALKPQCATLRAIAGSALRRIRVDPLTMDGGYERLGLDPRADDGFGAVWAAHAAAALADAAVDAACFARFGPPGAALVARLATYAGAAARSVVADGPQALALGGLALQPSHGASLLVLWNRSDEPAVARLSGPLAAQARSIWRIGHGGEEEAAGGLAEGELELGAFEVAGLEVPAGWARQ